MRMKKKNLFNDEKFTILLRFYLTVNICVHKKDVYFTQNYTNIKFDLIYV